MNFSLPVMARLPGFLRETARFVFVDAVALWLAALGPCVAAFLVLCMDRPAEDRFRIAGLIIGTISASEAAWFAKKCAGLSPYVIGFPTQFFVMWIAGFALIIWVMLRK